MAHTACYTDSEGREYRQSIPAGDYGMGHIVTTINGQPNRRCWGVWERQLERHAKCLAEQSP